MNPEASYLLKILVLLLLLFQIASTSNCFSTLYYPRILGSWVTGETYFTTALYDPAGNLIIGGSSSDSSVNRVYVSDVPLDRPILLSMNPSGKYIWTRSYYKSGYTKVSSIGRKNEITWHYLAVALNGPTSNTPLCILIVSFDDGALYKANVASSSGLSHLGNFQSNSLFIDSSKNAYAAFTTNDQRFGFMKFYADYSGSTSTLLLQLTSSQTGGQANVLVQNPNALNYYFIGGMIKQNSGNTFMSITSIKNDGTMAAQDSIGFDQGSSPLNPFSIQKMSIAYSSPDTQLAACSSNNYDVILSRFDLTSSTSMTPIYSTRLIGWTTCLQVLIPSHWTVFDKAYFMISQGQTLRFGWHDKSAWTENYFEQIYNEDPMNQFYSGFFDSNFQGFWVGRIQKITYPTTSSYWLYTMPIGIVMTVHSSISALPISDTYGSPSSLSIDVSIIFQQFSMSKDQAISIQLTDDASNYYVPQYLHLELANTPPGPPTITISTPDITPITYNLGNPTTVYSVPIWTASCDDEWFSYYHFCSGSPNGYTSTVLLQTSPLGIKILQTTDTNFIGTYTCTLRGSINNGQHAEKTFTVTMQNGCSSASLTSVPQNDITIYRGSGATSQAISQYITSPTGCQISYTLTQSNGTSLSTEVSLDPLTKTINVTQTSLIHEGFYQFELIGSISQNPSAQLATYFVIKILSPCASNVLSIGNQISFSYNIDSGAQLILFTLAGTQSIVDCGSFIYQLKNADGTTSDSIFSIDGSNNVVINTQNYNKRGTYNLRIEASTTNSLTPVVQDLFTVIVTDSCQGVILSNSNIFTTVSYQIGQGQLAIPFFDFSSNIDICSQMNYKIFIDNVISHSRVFLDTSNSPKKIIIDTTDASLTGTRVIKLEAETVIGLHTLSTSFNAIFIDPCLAQTLSLDSSMQNTISVPLNLLTQTQIQRILQTPTIIGCNLEYSMTFLASSILPQPLTFYPNEQVLRIYDQLSLSPYSITVDVHAEIIGRPTKFIDFPFTINFILPRYPLNLGAPYFSPSLKDQNLKQGDQSTYILPSLIDPDGGSASIVSIDLGQSKDFVSVQVGKLEINPSQHQQAGTYVIKITVSDGGEFPQVITYSLRIVIQQMENQSNESEENSSQQQSIKSLVITDPKKISVDIKAYIKSISLDGLVTIRFNKKMKVPFDYPKFDNYTSSQRNLDQRRQQNKQRSLKSTGYLIGNQVLIVRLKDKKGQFLDNLNYTWKVVSFKDYEMNMQMVFDDPRLISFSELDSLQVSFWANQKFMEQKNGYVIPHGYTIEKAISKQMRKDGNPQLMLIMLDLSENFQAFAGAFVTAVKVFVYSSFALNLALQIN